MTGGLDLQQHLDEPEGLACFPEGFRAVFGNVCAVHGDCQQFLFAGGIGALVGSFHCKTRIALCVGDRRFTACDDRVKEVRSPVVFGMLKGVLCAFCSGFFDDAAVTDLQHLAVIDGDMTDAVVEVVAGREDVVLHRKQSFLGHIRGRKLGGGSAVPVFVDLVKCRFGFLGDMERVGGACLDGIKFRFQPVKGVFREDLTAACDLGCGTDDQFLVADGDRQMFADMRKCLRTAGDDRFSFRRAVGFRQKNGAVCLDLGHMIKQCVDQPADAVGALHVDDIVFSHGFHSFGSVPHLRFAGNEERILRHSVYGIS